MVTINKEGMLVDKKIISRRYSSIEHGELKEIKAVVIHQTDAPTAQQTLNGYSREGNGAHFLIDKTGQIYQTASLRARCYHVGRKIKSKCLAIDRASCDSASMAKILAMSWTRQIKALDEHERAKNYPTRYPINSDSIGIELVGKSINSKAYEAVTAEQNASLKWLMNELYVSFKLTEKNVYRHPDISYKNPGEARSAQWK